MKASSGSSCRRAKVPPLFARAESHLRLTRRTSPFSSAAHKESGCRYRLPSSCIFSLDRCFWMEIGALDAGVPVASSSNGLVGI